MRTSDCIRERPIGAPGPPEYTAAEIEWLKAIDVYRTQRRKQFLTPCDVLAVLKSLGYRKVAPASTLDG